MNFTANSAATDGFMDQPPLKFAEARTISLLAECCSYALLHSQTRVSPRSLPGQNQPLRSDFLRLLAGQVTTSFPTPVLSDLAICSAHEKFTAILVIFLPLCALYLHPVAFA